MGWDRMGWDRMGWDGMGWDRMGWDMGWDRIWDGDGSRCTDALPACARPRAPRYLSPHPSRSQTAALLDVRGGVGRE